MFHTSALNNIYYEIRWFCEAVLDSKNIRMMQLYFDKDNMEIIHTLEVKNTNLR